MRRAFAWLTGLAGAAALARHLRRRRQLPEVRPPAADPAEELRDALARVRGADSERHAGGVVDRESATPEARRAEVHERAEQTIGRMREQVEKQ